MAIAAQFPGILALATTRAGEMNTKTGGRAFELLNWIDARFPLSKLWREHASDYYVPKNLNVWYNFGAMLLMVFALQLLTGIFLAMNYQPSAQQAFASVQYIMRDVNWGWLIRYIHATGASAFFVLAYLHIFRSLLYGSYRAPRELLWIIGVTIYLSLMAEAFMGYVLPWGNMSYWGAQVIVSLFGSIPYVGDSLVEWIRGDYFISDATLNRFFSLHVIAVPLILAFLVVIHILALHTVGSSNPDGIEVKEHTDEQGKPLDAIPFHPYYTVHDVAAVILFLIVFFAIVFFVPDLRGYFLEEANYDPANALQTPAHIRPMWYFTPFYAILRAVPDKLFGVLLMGAAVLSLYCLPWLDRSKVRSIRYRGWIFKSFLVAFAASFLTLGYIGMQPADATLTTVARGLVVVYFAFFLLMPWYTRIDPTKPVPERVHSRQH
jgi:ubiquinol-cytochrome c reductase cytochrome b subunit